MTRPAQTIDLSGLWLRDDETHVEYVARREQLLKLARASAMVWLGDLSGFRFETDYDGALELVHNCGHRVQLLSGGEQSAGHPFLADAVTLGLAHADDGCLPRPQRTAAEVIAAADAAFGLVDDEGQADADG
jgi:hypothetical protein